MNDDYMEVVIDRIMEQEQKSMTPMERFRWRFSRAGRIAILEKKIESIKSRASASTMHLAFYIDRISRLQMRLNNLKGGRP